MRNRLLSVACALVLAGCGSSTSTTPSGSAGAIGATSFAGSGKPLIVVVTEPAGSGPSTIRVLRPDGSSVARADAAGGPVVATSLHAVFFVDGTAMKQILATGKISTVGELPGIGRGQFVTGLAVAADGGSWVYGVAGASHDDHGTAYTTELFAGRPGALGVPGATSSTRFGDLVPFGWNPRGVLIGARPDRVTASGPFATDDTLHGIGSGYVSLADASGETLRPLSTGTCIFEALAPDGTFACEQHGFGSPATVEASIRLTSPSGTTQDIPVAANAGMGFAHFSSDSKHLLFTTATVNGTTYTDQMTTLDIAKQALNGVGPRHLDSRAWLADLRTVAVDDASVGAPSLKLIGAGGKGSTTLLAGSTQQTVTFVGAIYATG